MNQPPIPQQPTQEDQPISSPTVPPQAADIQPKKSFFFPLSLEKRLAIIATAIGVLLLASVVIIMRLLGSVRSNQPITSRPTPTIQTATPTPLNRVVAPVASDSAFLTLESSISALQSRVGSTAVVDQRLTPPSLDLPLGFSNVQ